jgi:hypothetical protein
VDDVIRLKTAAARSKEQNTEEERTTMNKFARQLCDMVHGRPCGARIEVVPGAAAGDRNDGRGCGGSGSEKAAITRATDNLRRARGDETETTLRIIQIGWGVAWQAIQATSRLREETHVGSQRSSACRSARRPDIRCLAALIEADMRRIVNAEFPARSVSCLDSRVVYG